jgi:hypothetical protein
MTHQEAVDLAKRIVRDANTPVRTVLGQTNGAWIIHVIDKESRRSVNVASEGEWRTSQLNKSVRDARPRRPRRSDRLEADQATIEAGLNTVFDPYKEG